MSKHPITIAALSAGDPEAQGRLYQLIAEVLRSIAAHESDQHPNAA
jgi:hypothetical protein